MYFVDINLFNYNLQFLTATKIVLRLCNENFSLQVVRLEAGNNKVVQLLVVLSFTPEQDDCF